MSWNWVNALQGFSAVVALCLFSWALTEFYARVHRRWGANGVYIAIALTFALVVGLLCGVGGKAP